MQTTGRTTEEGEHPHDHAYEINDNGNGKTTSTSSGNDHVHVIQNFKVLPAGSDQHTHRIKKLKELFNDLRNRLKDRK